MSDESHPRPANEPAGSQIPRDGRSGLTVIDGRMVHYLEWGHASKASVLALHGGGQTAHMFGHLALDLHDRYHVLAPDLASHGDSEDLACGQAFSRQNLAATLPGLLDAFGLGPSVVIGASLGGLVAVSFARNWPERVAAMVLIDVAGKLEESGVRRIIAFMTEHEAFDSLEDAASAISEYLPRATTAGLQGLHRSFRQRDDGRWVWKHALGRANQAERAQAFDTWSDILDGFDDDASQVTVPTLLLRGSDSDVLSMEGTQDLLEKMPSARLEIVPNAGHLAAGDNPQHLSAVVRSFLQEIVGHRTN